MKRIETLIEDIYGLFGSGKEFDENLEHTFGDILARSIEENVIRDDKGGRLRGSILGKPCMREKWYAVNQPEAHEGFTPATKFKFLYGHLIEEMVLYLAAAAGHKVEGMQDELRIGSSVVGHRDAVIDGVLVDVKSCAPMTFQKFWNHLKPEEDGFGYIGQLQAYLWASQNDPLVTDKKRAAFIGVHKINGQMCLDFHDIDNKDWGADADWQLSVVNKKEAPPKAFTDEEDGKGGNRKLGLLCSYCGWKSTCWPRLRSFKYAGGPRHLTVVAKAPMNRDGPIPEIK